MYDYLLIGAGLFNSVFASLATSHGEKCLVIERETDIGGQCYTRLENDIHIHQYGAHIFNTENKKVWEYINKFCEMKPFVNQPIAKYKGEVYNLPFNMNTFSKVFGITDPEEAKRIISKETNEYKKDVETLEDYAISCVGKTLYEILIKGYTEKQWGMPCKELPKSIMRRIPIRFTYDNNYYNSCWQGIPSQGYTSMMNNMLAGSEVRCGEIVSPRDYHKYAKKVIYTGPLDEYFNFSDGELEWRSLRFKEKWYGVDNWQGNAVVNYTESEIPYTRSIEHKHFLGETSENTIVSFEFPVKWEKGDRPYYPIESIDNNKKLEIYRKKAREQENVVFAGRLATYSYNNMQDTVQNAFSLFKRINRENGNV